MAVALMLLIFTLAFVVYRDRDFWLPAEVPFQDNAQQASLAETSKSMQQRHSKSKAHGQERTRPGTVVRSIESSELAPDTATTSTTSPLLEVEVVAANSHRKLRLGSNIVQVNLERDSPLSQDKSNVVEPSPSERP